MKSNKNKIILDATCGGRHIWYDKKHPAVVYMDRRVEPKGTIKVRPNWCVEPDVIADFRKMPFRSNTFALVVFDPPHIIRKKTSTSVIRMKYGELGDDWARALTEGFNECWRVLRPEGTLIMKWSETDKKLSDILKLLRQQPLFGSRTGTSAVWLTFMKL